MRRGRASVAQAALARIPTCMAPATARSRIDRDTAQMIGRSSRPPGRRRLARREFEGRALEYGCPKDGDPKDGGPRQQMSTSARMDLTHSRAGKAAINYDVPQALAPLMRRAWGWGPDALPNRQPASTLRRSTAIARAMAIQGRQRAQALRAPTRAAAQTRDPLAGATPSP